MQAPVVMPFVQHASCLAALHPDAKMIAPKRGELLVQLAWHAGYKAPLALLVVLAAEEARDIERAAVFRLTFDVVLARAGTTA